MGADLSTSSIACSMPEQWSSCVEDVDRHALSSEGVSSNILIFDWDDTLLCSTAVRLREATDEQLRELEDSVEAILRTSALLGETLIITNGNRTWVQDSARRYLPRLLPLLEQFPILSARALYEDEYPGDPFMWKHACFEDLLVKDREYGGEHCLNLIALGDQYPELDAAMHVQQMLGGGSIVKTVKFKAAPSVPQLIGQLYRMEKALPSIVNGNQNCMYSLVAQDLPPYFEHLSASADSWRCASEQEIAADKASYKDPVDGIKNIFGFLTA